MSYVIAVLGQKGGVGKSTLAQLVARGYAGRDYSVLLADMDTGQQTSVRWNEVRSEANLKPEIAVKNFSSVALAQAEAKKLRCELIVYDSTPYATQQTRDIAKTADLVLIPCSTSKFDMNPQITLAHELVKAGAVKPKQIQFVFCRITATKGELEAAISYIKEAGYNVSGDILEERTGYRNAQEEGKALSEAKFKSLALRSANIFTNVTTTLLKAIK